MQGRGKKTERSRMKFGKTLDASKVGFSLQFCLLPQVSLSVWPTLSWSLSFLLFPTLKPLKKEGKLVYDSGLPVPPP